MAITVVADYAEGLLYQQMRGAENQLVAESWFRKAFKVVTKKPTGTPRGDVWLFPVKNAVFAVPGAPIGTTAWETPVAYNFPDEAELPVRQMGAIVGFEDRLMDGSTRGTDLIPALAGHIKEIQNALDYSGSAYIWGDGTGILQKVQDTASGTTIEGVDDDYYEFTRWLEPWVDTAPVDVGTTSDYDARTATAPTVDSITDNDTWEASAAVDPSANDIVTFQNVGGTVPYGLDLWVSTTGTAANINRATAGNEYWESQVTSSVGALTLPALDTAVNDARGNGGNPNLFVCDDETGNAVMELLRQYHRSAEPITDMAFGGRASGYRVVLGGTPGQLVIDWWGGRRTLYVIDSRDFAWFETSPAGFSVPGSPGKSQRPAFFPDRNDTRGHELRYAHDVNLMCFHPRRHARLDGITPVTS